MTRDDIKALLTTMPFVRDLGVDVLDIYKNGLICYMPFSEKLIGNVVLPAIHGGAISTFLESSSVATANWSASDFGLTDIALPVSVSLEYLRSAKPQDLYARTEVVKQGRRLVQVICHCYQDDPEKPVTIMHASFIMTKSQGA
jgi:uncharacterized protein (TIGR00369 family)